MTGENELTDKAALLIANAAWMRLVYLNDVRKLQLTSDLAYHILDCCSRVPQKVRLIRSID